jgi:hypothetical protein
MAVIVVGDVDTAKIEQSIKDDFGPIKDRAPAAPVPDRSVPLQKETLISIVSDPELTRSSVTIERKRPREGEDKVADYRRDLVERFVEHMMDDRFEEMSQKPDAKFLGAGVGGDTMSHDVASFSMGAAVQDGQLEDGISLLATEAKRVREFGFGASEMERAKQWMAAFYEHAYTDRILRARIRQLLPERRAEPRHRVRVPARAAAAAGNDGERRVRARQVAVERRRPRDPRDLAAEGRHPHPHRRAAAGGAGRRQRGARVGVGRWRRGQDTDGEDAYARRRDVTAHHRRPRRHRRALRERRRSVAEAD